MNIQSFWRDYCRLGFLKKPQQRIVSLIRGTGFYSHEDSYELFSKLSRRAACNLRAFRKDLNGYPISLQDPALYNGKPSNEARKADEDKCLEKWGTMLDDMIFYHDVCAGTNKVSKIYILEKLHPYFNDKHFAKYCAREDLNLKGMARYRKGKYYFSRFYESLWC